MNTDEYTAAIEHCKEYDHSTKRVYIQSGNAKNGTRNIHEFSGRIE